MVQPGAAQTEPTLRELADQRGFVIGTAVAVAPLLSTPLYAETLAREFNAVTAENVMKWDSIQPGRGVFTYDQADIIVEFAEEHDMLVRGHTLVWHNQLPRWLRSGEWEADELREILRDHIMNFVGHYRGRVYAWDVVNEAVADSARMRDTMWLEVLGEEYIADAFRWAHEADPDALLFYNDYNSEGMTRKSNAIYRLVEGLVNDGVPIHGVGLQMHLVMGREPSPEEVAENIARLNALGLEVHITEIDVRIQDASGTPEELLEQQAEVYRNMTRVCLEAENCTALVTWGLTDAYSWIPGFTGKPDAPLLFDEEFQPKPAYYALIDVLSSIVPEA
jgi:endo-1,4-beta-xylanase